jgi:hypothetical protein
MVNHVEGCFVCLSFCGCGVLISCGTGGTEKWAGSTTDDGRPLCTGHKKSGVKHYHKEKKTYAEYGGGRNAVPSPIPNCLVDGNLAWNDHGPCVN